MNHRAAILSVIPLLAAAALAQRPTPTFEWQKRNTVLTYGAVPVGQHTLEKLAVGATWRLGMNEASTWTLDMPVVAGDDELAPGGYRVQLLRSGEQACELLVNGSGQALGGKADGKVDGKVAGKLGKAAKPVKKLAIEWKKGGAAADGNQPVQLVVQFGDHEWLGDAVVVGHKAVTVGGWKLAVWALPSRFIEGGTAVPVATLSKGEQSWNVVCSKSEAKLVPWMAAPTASFGFGEVVPPDAALTTTGTVERLEIKVEKARPVVEHITSSAGKGSIVLELGFAQDALRVTLPEPKAKK